VQHYNKITRNLHVKTLACSAVQLETYHIRATHWRSSYRYRPWHKTANNDIRKLITIICSTLRTMYAITIATHR